MIRFVFVTCLLAFVAVSAGASEIESMAKWRDPVVSTVCSVVIPGGGQAYNGQWRKAGAIVGAELVGWIIFASTLEGKGDDEDEFDVPEDKEGTAAVGILIVLGSRLYSIIDAPITSNRINKRHQRAHLIQHDGEHFSFGIDPITSRRRWGTMLSLRF